MKTTNLNIRLTPTQKKLLQSIASQKKLSMTDLIIAFIYNESNKGEKNNANN